MATALSQKETAGVVQLYEQLDAMDKLSTKYTLKSRRQNLPGPWRVSRRKAGLVPGHQATEW